MFTVGGPKANSSAEWWCHLESVPFEAPAIRALVSRVTPLPPRASRGRPENGCARIKTQGLIVTPTPHREFRTLAEMFVRTVETQPRSDAFLFKSQGSYQPVSSGDALRRVAALAAGLEGLGIRRGDRVAIIAENRLEWALSDYALLGLGAIVVPIYPTLL